MRVPVAPPSSAKSWGTKKKAEEDDNVPAWKQKLKATKSAEPATPAVPAWKQKLKANAPAAASSSSTEPAWKQKLKTQQPVAAASPSEPAWKQKLKSNKPPADSSSPAVPAWKAKLQAAKTSPASSPVPAWKAKLKSTETADDNTNSSPATTEIASVPNLEGEPEVIPQEEEIKNDESSQSTGQIEETDLPNEEEEDGERTNSTTKKFSMDASDSDSGGNISDDSDDDSSGGGFNFDPDSSSSSSDDDSDGMLLDNDDDGTESLIPKHELDIEKRMSTFFEVRNMLKDPVDAAENGGDDEDGLTQSDNEKIGVEDSNNRSDTDLNSAGPEIELWTPAIEPPPQLPEVLLGTEDHEDDDDDDDDDVDTGVDMVAMEVEKLKMQQALLSIEDDLDSAADSIEGEEESWMVSAAPSEDMMPKIDYQAMLKKTAELKNSNDGAGSQNSMASLGMSLTGLDHSSQSTGSGGGVFCAKIDDMDVSQSSFLDMSLGQLEISAVDENETDELPIESWMMEIDAENEPDIDYATLMAKLGEDDDDSEYKAGELDISIPQFEFDADQLKGEADQMARMAEGFDKTMDEAQEDLDAASEEFAQEATKNATEGIKHKQRLTEKITSNTIAVYDADADPDLEGKHRNLMVLMHAAKCQANTSTGNKCGFPFCKASLAMMQHITACKDKHCKVGYCPGSKYVLRHAKQINMAMMKRAQVGAARKRAIEEAERQQKQQQAKAESDGHSRPFEKGSHDDNRKNTPNLPPGPPPRMTRRFSTASRGSSASLHSIEEDSDEDDTSDEEAAPRNISGGSKSSRFIGDSEHLNSSNDGRGQIIISGFPTSMSNGNDNRPHEERANEEDSSDDEDSHSSRAAIAGTKEPHSPVYANKPRLGSNSNDDIGSDSDSSENEQKQVASTSLAPKSGSETKEGAISSVINSNEVTGVARGLSREPSKWDIQYSDDEESEEKEGDPNASKWTVEYSDEETTSRGEGSDHIPILAVRSVPSGNEFTTVGNSQPGEGEEQKGEACLTSTEDCAVTSKTGSIREEPEMADETNVNDVNDVDQDSASHAQALRNDASEKVEAQVETESETECPTNEGGSSISGRFSLEQEESNLATQGVAPDDEGVENGIANGLIGTSENAHIQTNLYNLDTGDTITRGKDGNQSTRRSDVYGDVRFKKSIGSVTLTSSELQYRPENTREPEVYHIAWDLILKQQASPPSHTKHLLKIVLSSGKPATFQMSTRAALEHLRDGIVKNLKEFADSNSNSLQEPLVILGGEEEDRMHSAVRFKKMDGCVVLTASALSFRSEQSPKPLVIPWKLVTKQQASPPSHPKALLQVVLSEGKKAITLQCVDRVALERLRLDIARSLDGDTPVIGRAVATGVPVAAQTPVCDEADKSTDIPKFLVYQPVEFKSLTGSLILEKENLVFAVKDAGNIVQNPATILPWKSVLRQQAASPPNSGKHMLKLTLTNGKSATFKLCEKKTLEGLLKSIADKLRSLQITGELHGEGNGANTEAKLSDHANNDNTHESAQSDGNDGGMASTYQVCVKSIAGSLVLDQSEIRFTPTPVGAEKDDPSSTKNISLHEIAKYQASPSNSPKHMLQVLRASAGTVTFRLQDRQMLEKLLEDLASRMKLHKEAQIASSAIGGDRAIFKNPQKLKEEGEEKAKAEQQKLKETEEKARLEAEKLAEEQRLKEEAEEKARLEAEKLAAEQKLREEAEEKARLEAEKTAEEHCLKGEALKKAEEEAQQLDVEKPADGQCVKEAEDKVKNANKGAVEQQETESLVGQGQARFVSQNLAEDRQQKAEARENATKEQNDERIITKKAKDEATKKRLKAKKERLAALKRADEERLAVEATKKVEEEAARAAEEATIQKQENLLKKAEEERLEREAALQRIKEKRLAMETAAKIAEEERLLRVAATKVAEEERLAKEAGQAIEDERTSQENEETPSKTQASRKNKIKEKTATSAAMAQQKTTQKAEAAKAKKQKLAKEKAQKTKRDQTTKNSNDQGKEKDMAPKLANGLVLPGGADGPATTAKKKLVKATSVYEPVVLNHLSGSLLLDKEHMRFMPSNGKEGGRASIPWLYVVKHEASSIMSGKTVLKIFLSQGDKIITLELKNRSDMNKLKKDVTDRLSAWEEMDGASEDEPEKDDESPPRKNNAQDMTNGTRESETTTAKQGNPSLAQSLVSNVVDSPSKETTPLTVEAVSKSSGSANDSSSKNGNENDGRRETPENNGPSVPNNEVMSAKKAAEDIDSFRQIYKPVKFKSQTGSVILNNKKFVFQPSQSAKDGVAVVSIEWSLLVRCQSNPQNSVKALLKLVLKDGKNHTFQTKNRGTLTKLKDDVDRRIQENQLAFGELEGEKVKGETRADTKSLEQAQHEEEEVVKADTDETVSYAVKMGVTPGELILGANQIEFSPSNEKEVYKKTFMLCDVAKTQRNPPKSAKAVLMIVMLEGNTATIQFKNRRKMMELQKDITKRLDRITDESSRADALASAISQPSTNFAESCQAEREGESGISGHSEKILSERQIGVTADSTIENAESVSEHNAIATKEYAGIQACHAVVSLKKEEPRDPDENQIVVATSDFPTERSADQEGEVEIELDAESLRSKDEKVDSDAPSDASKGTLEISTTDTTTADAEEGTEPESEIFEIDIAEEGDEDHMTNDSVNHAGGLCVDSISFPVVETADSAGRNTEKNIADNNGVVVIIESKNLTKSEPDKRQTDSKLDVGAFAMLHGHEVHPDDAALPPSESSELNTPDIVSDEGDACIGVVVEHRNASDIDESRPSGGINASLKHEESTHEAPGFSDDDNAAFTIVVPNGVPGINELIDTVPDHTESVTSEVEIGAPETTELVSEPVQVARSEQGDLARNKHMGQAIRMADDVEGVHNHASQNAELADTTDSVESEDAALNLSYMSDAENCREDRQQESHDDFGENLDDSESSAAIGIITWKRVDDNSDDSSSSGSPWSSGTSSSSTRSYSSSSSSSCSDNETLVPPPPPGEMTVLESDQSSDLSLSKISSLLGVNTKIDDASEMEEEEEEEEGYSLDEGTVATEYKAEFDPQAIEPQTTLGEPENDPISTITKSGKTEMAGEGDLQNEITREFSLAPELVKEDSDSSMHEIASEGSDQERENLEVASAADSNPSIDSITCESSCEETAPRVAISENETGVTGNQNSIPEAIVSANNGNDAIEQVFGNGTLDVTRDNCAFNAQLGPMVDSVQQHFDEESSDFNSTLGKTEKSDGYQTVESFRASTKPPISNTDRGLYGNELSQKSSNAVSQAFNGGIFVPEEGVPSSEEEQSPEASTDTDLGHREVKGGEERDDIKTEEQPWHDAQQRNDKASPEEIDVARPFDWKQWRQASLNDVKTRVSQEKSTIHLDKLEPSVVIVVPVVDGNDDNDLQKLSTSSHHHHHHKSTKSRRQASRPKKTRQIEATGEVPFSWKKWARKERKMTHNSNG